MREVCSGLWSSLLSRHHTSSEHLVQAALKEGDGVQVELLQVQQVQELGMQCFSWSGVVCSSMWIQDRAWVCLPEKAAFNSSRKSSIGSFSRAALAKASFHSRLWPASSMSLGGTRMPILKNLLWNESWGNFSEQGRGWGGAGVVVVVVFLWPKNQCALPPPSGNPRQNQRHPLATKSQLWPHWHVDKHLSRQQQTDKVISCPILYLPAAAFNSSPAGR